MYDQCEIKCRSLTIRKKKIRENTYTSDTADIQKP